MEWSGSGHYNYRSFVIYDYDDLGAAADPEATAGAAADPDPDPDPAAAVGVVLEDDFFCLRRSTCSSVSDTKRCFCESFAAAAACNSG